MNCVIYGDESGVIGQDRFFCIGVVGTRYSQRVDEQLKQLRKNANFFGEVTYKSSDDRRALCAIKWMDWVFSGQKLIKFKVLLKDSKNFNVSYFKDNKYDTGAAQLAYCQTYREVLKNFADFKDDKKYFVYHRIDLKKMKVDEHLGNHINGLEQKDCYSYSTTKKRPHSEEYTLHAELLQLTDLLTSSFRGLVCAVNDDGNNKSWVKRALHQNLLFHLSGLKPAIKDERNFYWTAYQPFTDQSFVLYNWKPR